MVNILKHGTTYFQKCPHCGCEFTYMKNDTTLEVTTYLGISNVAQIICPDCNTVLDCTFEIWKEKDQ